MPKHREDDDDDGDLEIAFDLRDIPGQIQKEVEFIERNDNRSPDIAIRPGYSDRRNGTRIGKWTGLRKTGETIEAGILKVKTEASIYENKMNVGNINIGITDEEDQKGIEAEVKALSASHRLGPVKVNTDVLSAGCEMGIGRNNGGFVRANVASIGGNVGPVAGSLGIGFDSGARVGEEGVEIRALGTGFMVDRNEGIEVSVLGSKLKLKLW